MGGDNGEIRADHTLVPLTLIPYFDGTVQVTNAAAPAQREAPLRAIPQPAARVSTTPYGSLSDSAPTRAAGRRRRRVGLVLSRSSTHALHTPIYFIKNALTPRSQPTKLNHLLFLYLVQVRLRYAQGRVASEHRLVAPLLLEEVLRACLGLGLGAGLG